MTRVDVLVAGRGEANPYVTDESFGYEQGSGDPTDSFLVSDRMYMYGGFEGDELDLNERDPISNVTLLSASSEITGGPGEAFNTYHVLVTADFVIDARLDGFRVILGKAGGPGTDQYGGGILVRTSAPRIVRCIFRSNVAVLGGGAMDILTAIPGAAGPLVSNCVFLENVTGGSGGAVLASDPQAGDMDVAFINCLFTDNVAEFGAGMFVEADLTLVNSTLSANFAMSYGGALTFMPSGDGFLRNSILWDNEDLQGTSEATNLSRAVGSVDTSLDVASCCIEGLYFYDGNENIGDDPRFVDNAMGDFRLACGSPCRNTGDNNAIRRLSRHQRS